MTKVIKTSFTLKNNDLVDMFDHINRHLTIMESNTIKFNENTDSSKIVLPKEIHKTPSQYISKFINHSKPVNTRLIGQTCPICVECFLPSETYHQLSCNHCFHSICIEKWLMTDLDELSCPLCRCSQYNDPL